MNCLFALLSPSMTFVSKSSAVFQEFVLYFRRDIFSVERGEDERDRLPYSLLNGAMLLKV